MNVDFKQAQSIFHGAGGRSMTRRRARFLDEVGGEDANLRSHLELLIDSHNQSGTFLEQGAIVSPTINLSALDEPIAEHLGSRSVPTSSRRRSAKVAWASSTWPSSRSRSSVGWR